MKSKVSTKKYKKLFQINYQLRDLVMTMIEAKPKVITPRDCVACFTLSKIYKTHGVAVNLAKHGYAEDADMLIRTLF